MSYLVCHMRKFGMNGIKGLQRHYQREVAPEHSSNKDIRWIKTQENYDLHTNGNINFNLVVKNRIEKGRVSDKTLRKDAVVVISILVASDKEFFEQLGPRREKAFFEASYAFLKDRYGEDNVISAMVHKDESTPHMHFTLVPITKDGRLSAKTMFDRNELRGLQSDFPNHLQKQGFTIERGISSDKKHIETRKFKQTLVKIKEREMEESKGRLKKVGANHNIVNNINSRAKHTVFGNNVVIPSTEYNKLVDIALSSVHKSIEIQKLSQDLEQTQRTFKQQKNDSSWVSKRNLELEMRIKELESYKKTVKELTAMFEDNPELGKKVIDTLNEHKRTKLIENLK